MEAKHTPGPWSHRNGRIFAADRENLTIANVARAADGDYSPANGQVLAAAPELLDALIAAEAALNHIRCTSRSVPWDDTGPAVEQARAAIAKATA